MDVVRKSLKLQTLINHMEMHDSTTEEQFIDRRKLLRRGDFISKAVPNTISSTFKSELTLLLVAVTGYPYRAQSGHLSLRATGLPVVLSPCLHQFPVPKSVEEASGGNESQFLARHVEMLANRQAMSLLVRRSQIIRLMRNFLIRGAFTEVQTPILSTRAGGAIARPFETTASEFPEKQLSLRIAPELWLKKLVVGGMERIFEIGPCFRNEGEATLHAFSVLTDNLQALTKRIIQNLRLVSFTAHTAQFRTC